jgi:SAM-dependent methyltransferase
MPSSEPFDRTYFEDGVRSGKSLYENYHWMPERSFPEAHWFVRHMNIPTDARILDFGCAKGYFVKAMHLLGYRKTHGYDISRYALDNCDPLVRGFLLNALGHAGRFEYGYCKDVLEHCPSLADLNDTLYLMSLTKRWLLIVPCAQDGKYIIPEYEKDVTHHLRLTYAEWSNAVSNFFHVNETHFRLGGLKEKWVNQYPSGNMFLVLTARGPHD